MKKYMLALILLALSGMIFGGIGNTESKEALKLEREDEQSETILEINPSDSKTIVYYFHGTYRCPSCLQIEAWSFDAIQEQFAYELEEGAMVWKTIDIDKPENNHFVKDYEISTQSLILVKIIGEKEKRHKSLAKVWEYLPDQKAFYEYVRDEIDKFLADD